MIPFRDWSPTQFDVRGLGLADKQDWLVCQLMQTRDSDGKQTNMFAALVRRLNKIDHDNKDHEVHRFGHWACGWFDIMIVRQNSVCARREQVLEKRRNNGDSDS